VLSIAPITLGFWYNRYRPFRPHLPIPLTTFSSSNPRSFIRDPPRKLTTSPPSSSISSPPSDVSVSPGPFSHWRAYYPHLSTLIQLLALPAIHWPTIKHVTSQVLDYKIRQGVCWAIVGRMKCVSGAMQMLVMSNLALLPSPPPGDPTYAHALSSASGPGHGHGPPRADTLGISGLPLLSSSPLSHPILRLEKPPMTAMIMSIQFRRRWERNEMLLQAALSMRECYFAMDRVEVWRRKTKRV
jgi:hypothetical protein